jgi:hypothetical protein
MAYKTNGSRTDSMEVGKCIMRPMNLLILFGIGRRRLNRRET